MRRSFTVVALCTTFLACSTNSGRLSQNPPPAPQPRAETEPLPDQPEAAAEAERYSQSAELIQPVRSPATPDAALETETAPTESAALSPAPAIARQAADPPEPVRQSQPEAAFVLPAPTGFSFDPELPALPEETALLDELTEQAEEIPEDYSLPEVREARLRRTESDLPLTLNDHVVRLVNYFTTGRGVKTMRVTLGRSGAYRAMIERVLAEEGVPAELFYLAQAESGFRPTARSYAMATGMWQFMAFRGKQYGLRQDRYLEERYDPESATRAAARHLRDLYIEFQDWYLAMAAYNAGPNRVGRAIQRGGTRDYWELCRKRLLPRQTRNYVPIILAMTYVGKNLDMYDIGTVDYAPPQRYDTVLTNSEISLELAADLTDSSVSELRALNPALLRSATPPYSYPLRVRADSAEQFVAEIARIPVDKRLDWRRGQVGDGETIEQIANRFDVKPDAILAANGLRPDDPLTPGSRLTIPASTSLQIYRSYAGGDAGGLLEPGSGRYRIARGDTLGGIARRFGVSISQLREWNGLPNSRIRAGRYLIVRPGGAVAAGAAPAGRYKVRPGDSLSRIAQRYGTTVGQLQAWNGLRSSRILVGDVLSVPGPSSSQISNGAAAQLTRYRIRTGDTLGAIAARFGVTVSDLMAWNGLQGSRIRAGQYLNLRPNRVAKAAAPPTAQPISYRVRPGDNLISIAGRHGVSVRDLQRWNSLRGSRIHAGQSLIVGHGASAAPPVVSQPTKSQPAKTADSESSYRVRAGDTLGHIAERYGVSAADLRRWNGIRGSLITPGDTLVVRALGQSTPSPAAANPAPSAAQPARYRVRPGDTLGSIAARFGVTIAELKAWNGLRNSRIQVGETLTLYRSAPQEGQYRIQPGDTLETIAARFAVTVGQLREWNRLSSSRIVAGDYLLVRPNSGT